MTTEEPAQEYSLQQAGEGGHANPHRRGLMAGERLPNLSVTPVCMATGMTPWFG
jgi:hypothetical protein